MRSSKCRDLRLNRFAGLGIAAGMVLAVPGWAASPLATQTRLSAQTQDLNGRTQATLSIAVNGEDGQPAGGAVVIEDAGKPLASAALNPQGTTEIRLSLPPGEHSLTAAYAGDTAHAGSKSDVQAVSAQAGAAPSFTISVSPASMTLTAGQSGTVTASVTPVNASALTAPMFVTLSCAGFPDQSSCTFTPENVEILPGATAAVTSSMVITTQSPGTRGPVTPTSTASSKVGLSILFPGALGLAGLAFATRRRRWLSRLSLIALVGFVATLGMTACAPRYNYYNHGPPYNLPTPAGTYTLTVSAQSSNGVTAATQVTPFALTVQ